MPGFFENPLGMFGNKPELPKSEIVETENALLWNGKQFTKSPTDNEFSIEAGKLTKADIEEFTRALQARYPEADYEYVKPFAGAKFEVFAKGAEAEKEDDWNKSDSPFAA